MIIMKRIMTRFDIKHVTVHHPNRTFTDAFMCCDVESDWNIIVDINGNALHTIQGDIVETCMPLSSDEIPAPVMNAVLAQIP